jgi:hypothetical protein
MVLLAGLPLFVGAAPGCKKDEPAKPDPSAATDTANASSRVGPKHPPRNAFNRPDPQVTKDYRVDVCYYGTLSLRQARDAYLGSLGKDEPGPKKIPSFGGPSAPPGAPGSPGASASAGKPAAPPTPPPAAPPKPGASGAPAASVPQPPPVADRAREFLARLPHERNARSCASAVPLKDAPMGEVDTQLAAFSPFAVELAKDITTAQQYYMREEYSKDSFARGKELDKKLREQFAKLDEMSDKLGAALEAWRKDHQPDTSKMEEGEKDARAFLEDAREVLLAVAHKKADGEAWKALLDKLDKSAAALKTYADAHTSDNWTKIMAGPVESFVKTVKGAKITPDKSFDSDSYLQLVTGFTGLLDARQRAVARGARPGGPGSPAAPGAEGPGNAHPPPPAADPPK